VASHVGYCLAGEQAESAAIPHFDCDSAGGQVGSTVASHFVYSFAEEGEQLASSTTAVGAEKLALATPVGVRVIVEALAVPVEAPLEASAVVALVAAAVAVVVAAVAAETVLAGCSVPAHH
jgi:hypothetical protein